MTTNDLTQAFIDAAYIAYKHVYKNTPLYSCLQQHKEIKVEGVIFTYWKEFVCYKMAKYMRKVVPEAIVQVVLDGNNSTIELELSDKEQQKLNAALYSFDKKYNLI